MAQRDDILDAVRALTLATGRLPSLQAVARATGLTKQGVLHYFPSRTALDHAVTMRALQQVDAAMTSARTEGGSVVETYLRLSSPSDDDRAAALLVVASVQGAADRAPAPELVAAVERWELLLAEELGDPVLAQVVRLTGDGLFAEALVTGRGPDPERLRAIIDHFRGQRAAGR